MVYNEKYKRYVTKQGLDYRVDHRIKISEPVLIYVDCKPTKKGYVRLKCNGQNVFLHRLVWETFNGPVPEGYEIDHINGIKTDNRLENLRCVTHELNMNNPITRETIRKGVWKLWHS